MSKTESKPRPTDRTKRRWTPECRLSSVARMNDAMWSHLAGDTSAPFVAPVGIDIAVKVIDERGNELPVIRRLA